MATGLIQHITNGQLIKITTFIVIEAATGTAYSSDGPMILNTNKNAIFLLLNTKQNPIYCVTCRKFRDLQAGKVLYKEAGNKLLSGQHASLSQCQTATTVSGAAFQNRNEHRVCIPFRRPHQGAGL